ncbi:MAG: hypothetical protein G01um101416_1169 [Microgenomates group bacterium Gr01-1014_16]|nr:MAG: hypothetical protein G01um101416_1169 [Microgenomates group bacterium Gr01-1014_16]
MVILLGVVIGAVGWVGRGNWDGKGRFTVIDIGEEIRVESFDPEIGRGVRFELPGKLVVESVGGRGKWRVEAMASLAKKYGLRWGGDSVADYLGIGYTSVKSKLGLADKWQWWRRGNDVEWEEADMIKRGLVKEVVEVDGERVWELSETWPISAGELFVSAAIANKNTSIVIVNASGRDGAGGNAARAIESAGIKVEKVESREKEPGKCEVKSNRRDKSGLVVTWIREQYDCQWAEGGDKIEVTLGTGYSEWWRGN